MWNTTGESMTNISLKSNRKQSGQMLIHLAEIFVSAGLVVGVALQGNVFMESYRFSEAYDDLKHIENEVWAFHELHELWPTQCNEFYFEGKVSKSIADFCNTKSEEMQHEIKALFSKKAEKPEWSRDFAIQLSEAPSGKQKQAIILQNVDPEFAVWLDEKIDGDTSPASGRVTILEDSTTTVSYFYESQIN